MNTKMIAEIIVYQAGQEPFSCARRNGEDAHGIARIANSWLADGADRVTVSVRGTEYEVGAWLAYINEGVTA